jgi:putative transposase
VLEPLIPTAKPGCRPRGVDLREIVNGIRCLLRSGGRGACCRTDRSPWEPVYAYFRGWQDDGTWEGSATTLGRDLRAAQGRDPGSSAAFLDS